MFDVVTVGIDVIYGSNYVLIYRKQCESSYITHSRL